MTYCHYDRLTALDSAFLDLEDGNAHMHIGAVALFEEGPLASKDGGIDFERILASITGALQTRDCFQQKLARVPALGHPVWVDDVNFNIRYHVRQTCLPAPGSERLLKRLAGRIMSEELDRGKPLWELWFVEGVEGNLFAVISKIHHSLADGLSGVDLLTAILRSDPKHRLAAAENWIPRPVPTGRRLLWDEMSRRARLPFELLRLGRRALGDVGNTVAAVQSAMAGLGEVLETGLHPASETPFNQPLGPHRRFDWIRFDLAETKEVSRCLGGTLNDLVLCIVAGAVGRFMAGRGLRIDDLEFRVLVPVSVRAKDEKEDAGNRVSMVLVPLPISESNPRKRLEQIVESTQEFKASNRGQEGEILAEIADWTFSGLMSRVARFGLQSRVANFVVTNVPGPKDPVYLLGARMLAAYPVVPLATNQGLGVALLSYSGNLYWGLNADWDLLPDLHEFVEAVHAEYEQLRTLAREGRRSAPRKKARRARRKPASVAANRAD
jgi:WS/DGAT/MGAT family acyltransferase